MRPGRRPGAGLAGALLLACAAGAALAADDGLLRGTGDLGLIVERAAGRVQVIETTGRTALRAVEGLGDLSHASVVYSRDGRFGYVFGRDGGLTKVDLLTGGIGGRIVQAGNSIGGAISQDGRLVAVSNYEPGGVRVFDADTLDPVADIPASYGGGDARSKVVGLVDAPGHRFVFSLYDAGEIWVADLTKPDEPEIRRFANVGRQPYDGLITPDGRFYLAGLFGEDGIALLDLWDLDQGVRRILDGYGRGEEPLPVYKMPHLEGWASAGDVLFLPAVGRHELLAVDRHGWREQGRIAVQGQPVFAVARPDGRQVWVNFAHPDNNVVQVIDVPSRKIVTTLAPGEAVLHIEFTPRGEQVWISARDSDRVVVYDTETFEPLAEIPADKPSGIFLAARANRIGL
ncbi:MAG TPA: cytochrome D1 domain-containing protein [Geminicoccaceae bacterium]|nr:cytochrome D1 domain-containing protein [Geminicoccaceae bacterium]